MKNEDQLVTVERRSVRRISSLAELDPSFRADYSLLKHGDPRATRRLGLRVGKLYPDAADPVFISSSPQGEVSTAARNLLLHTELKFPLIHLGREGDFDRSDFGRLSADERTAAMRTRKIKVSDEVQGRLSGSTLLVIDDLRASGSHERAIIEYFRSLEVPQRLIFLYVVEFDGALSASPEAEEELNHFEVSSINDLRVLEREAGGLLINSRVVKMLLAAGANQEGRVQLLEFLREASAATLATIRDAALSADGYASVPTYAEGFRLLISPPTAIRLLEL